MGSSGTLREKLTAARKVRGPALAADQNDNMPIGTLAAAFSLLILIILGSVYLSTQAQDYAREAVHTQTVITEIASVQALVRRAESGQRGYLLMNNDDYLLAYESGSTEVEATFQRLNDAIRNDEALTSDVKRLHILVDRKLDEMRSTIDLAGAGRRDQALDLMKTGRGLDLMKSIQALAQDLVAQQRSNLATTFERGRATSRDAIIASILAALVIVALALSSIRTFTRLIKTLKDYRVELLKTNDGLEEAVRERTADLIEVNEELQRYAYIVSHDLRSPLVNVMGFTSEVETLNRELLELIENYKEGKPVTAEELKLINDDFNEAIGFIKVSIERMDRLIAAILKLAREGRRIYNQEYLDLNAMLNIIVNAEAHRCQQLGAEIKIGDLPPIMGDRLAFEQIFGNLVDNALKYLVPGRPGRIEVTGEISTDSQIYRVADNGRGIDPRDHKRIFELFRRSGDQTVAGEGIGLAHVRAQIRSSGGTINCESKLNEGAVFVLRFPLTSNRRVYKR